MNRLEYISSLVNGYNTIADVGCDHAYISISAVSKYNVSNAYALDINDGPLANAVMNIEQAGLSDKIKTIKSDGLINFNEDCDAAIIAGMGASLIIKIINDSIDKINKMKAIILSPNNDESDLRKYLMDNSFKIINEKIIVENNHFYEIIVAIPNNYEKLSDMDILFGPKLRIEKSNEFISKYKKKLGVYEKSYVSASNSSKEELMKKIELIKKVL